MNFRIDDIVIAVLHFLKAEQNTFPADREFLHEAFYKMKSDFPELLGDMEFRTKGMFPESLVLDQTLGNLEAARALHRKNADPSYYQIEDVIDRSFGRFVGPRLRQAGLADEQLRQLAEAFSRHAENAAVAVA